MFTIWPIDLQISGGKEIAAAAAVDAAAFDANGSSLTASCALQDPPEGLSLSDCPDGRMHFAGGLGRSCNAPLGSPSSPPDAGAEEFSIEVLIIVTARFRLCILVDSWR